MLTVPGTIVAVRVGLARGGPYGVNEEDVADTVLKVLAASEEPEYEVTVAVYATPFVRPVNDAVAVAEPVEPCETQTDVGSFAMLVHTVYF